MNIEIEAKLKVDSVEQIAGRLSSLGGEFEHQLAQTDYYFDDAQRSLTKADRCLRLRRQLNGREENVLLTFKGPREKARFKRRQEIEIQVESVEMASELLEALGFEKRLVFEKKRQLWRLDNCEITLDELPLLGEFVEIEGPDEEKIADVQRKLGLPGLRHIADSYATLMRRELARLGTEKTEVLF